VRPSSASRPPLSVTDCRAGLGADKAALLSDLWKRNFVAMSQSMMGRTLAINQLVDMEWKFGGVCASRAEHTHWPRLRVHGLASHTRAQSASAAALLTSAVCACMQSRQPATIWRRSAPCSCSSSW
jgi:hypothetical protein